MSEIRHIVFDIGRVLIHYDPVIPYAEIIPDPERRRWFLENICTAEWNLEQDRGRTWREAEDLLIAEHPDWSEEIRAFRACWHDMVPHAYDGTVEILHKVMHAGHDVTLLTNFAADTFSEARQRFDFLDKTRGITVSGEIGLIKPDVEIYNYHAAAFDLETAATLFIDDSEKNVAGAISAGWHAVHFRDAQTLKNDLERLGVKA